MSPISWLVDFFKGAHPAEILAAGLFLYWLLSLGG